MADEGDDRERRKNRIVRGAALTAGGAAGLVAGGPAGAVVGAAAAERGAKYLLERKEDDGDESDETGDEDR